ncbi:hypothetical protein llap_8957 [Limosa lapponica baueri]|uniref:Uncharacterized protein n=1 Tax=Limosa lapponica baueri TaxID=1758121 RepID=A0A2I0U3R8_LIMLA|nr:hypothetical protein llap_8957 [Limosa lapponica baueri]
MQEQRCLPLARVHLIYFNLDSLVYLFIVSGFFSGVAFGQLWSSGLLILDIPVAKTLVVDLGFLLMFSARGSRVSLCLFAKHHLA